MFCCHDCIIIILFIIIQQQFLGAHPTQTRDFLEKFCRKQLIQANCSRNGTTSLQTASNKTNHHHLHYHHEDVVIIMTGERSLPTYTIIAHTDSVSRRIFFCFAPASLLMIICLNVSLIWMVVVVVAVRGQCVCVCLCHPWQNYDLFLLINHHHLQHNTSYTVYFWFLFEIHWTIYANILWEIFVSLQVFLIWRFFCFKSIVDIFVLLGSS